MGVRREDTETLTYLLLISPREFVPRPLKRTLLNSSCCHTVLGLPYEKVLLQN